MSLEIIPRDTGTIHFHCRLAGELSDCCESHVRAGTDFCLGGFESASKISMPQEIYQFSCF